MIDKRVVLVLPNLTLGGAERQAVALALALPKLGWEPIIAVAEMHGPQIETLRAAGLQIHDLGAEMWRRKWTPGFWLNLRRTIRRIMQITDEHNAPIIQSFLYWQNQLAVPAAMRSTSARAVITGRRNLGDFKDARRHYQWIEDRANRFTSAVVCNSEMVKEDVLRREEIAPEKVYVIHNGVDCDRFSNATPATLPLSGDGPVIGTVGNMKRQKRHDLFLRLIASVRKQIPNARGIIVGRDLGERGNLEKLRAELGLQDSVAFITSGEEAAPWYRAFDLFVLTSDFEGLPNVVLEAMAAGCAVVATDAGGTRELIDANCGHIVAVGDDVALGERVLELLKNEAQRKQFAVAGQKRAREHFSIDAMAQRYVSLYEELLS